MSTDRGAGVVLVSVALTLLMTVGLALGFVAGVFGVHRQAQAAADLTALAAAQSLVRGRDACAVAASVATANRARLRRCDVVEQDVIVKVQVTGPSWWGLAANPVAVARAGVG